jgi:hypothetical protein
MMEKVCIPLRRASCAVKMISLSLALTPSPSPKSAEDGGERGARGNLLGRLNEQIVGSTGIKSGCGRLLVHSRLMRSLIISQILTGEQALSVVGLHFIHLPKHGTTSDDKLHERYS